MSNKVYIKFKKHILDGQVEESNSSRFARFFRQHWAQHAGLLDAKTVQDIYNKLQVSALKKIKSETPNNEPTSISQTQSAVVESTGESKLQPTQPAGDENIGESKLTDVQNPPSSSVDQSKETAEVKTSSSNMEQSNESSDKESVMKSNQIEIPEIVTDSVNNEPNVENTETQNETPLQTPITIQTVRSDSVKIEDFEQDQNVLKKQLSSQSLLSDYSLSTDDPASSRLQRRDSRESLYSSMDDDEMEEDESHDQVSSEQIDQDESSELLDKSPYIIDSEQQHNED
jgi:hypothetical protein